MERKSLVAFVMVGIMISASFIVLASDRVSPKVSVLDSPFRVISTAGSSNSSIYYTMYVPTNSFTEASVKQALGNIGITPDFGGNLWTFNVPSVYSTSVDHYLHNISTLYHTTFFSSSNRSVAYPSVQTANGPSSNTIPFAYTPSLIARAYNFTWALNHGITGKGQTIVIVDAYGDPNIAYDVKAFDGVNGLPPVNLTIKYPYGTPGVYNSTWATETSTDVEWAHALAPGANIVLLIAVSAYTGYLQQVVSYAIQNKLGGVISLSWGTPENSLNTQAVNTYAKVYSQAAANGMDVFAASGDGGAYLGTSDLTVSYPASDPSVTGVGGTSLYVLNNQFRQYGWGGLNNGQSYGSGGGYSSYFKTPYWQNATGYNGTKRGVPDVALDADKYTGVYVISNGGQYTVGGTSVATPMWADIAALMRQYTNTSLSGINPLLYQIARSPSYSNSFSQITSGSNGYYNNTPGWNPVTGLGTPRVSNLLNVTKKVMEGYGGNVLFNGFGNYNASSVRGTLGFSSGTSNLLGNGSTFYYLGFYSGIQNSVKFGVVLNHTGEQLHLSIKQNNVTVGQYFGMPTGFGGNFSGLLLNVSSAGNSITVNSSGGFHYTIPAFLNFSGNMVPFAGAEQLRSESNLTVIGNAHFTNLQTFNGSGWSNVSRMYYAPFSSFDSPNYSTIGSSYTHSELDFYTQLHPKPLLLNGSSSVSPEITYNLTYGVPLKATFSIPEANSPVTWSINGSSIGSSVYSFPTKGGTYVVNGTFTDSLNSQFTVSRTIYIPGIMESNVSLNFSIPGFTSTPPATVTTMWFYSYAYSKYMEIPTLNTSYELSVQSTGFHTVALQQNPSSNISLTLVPEPVNVTVFVFNGNSTVTFDNSTVSGNLGYYSKEVTPTTGLRVNISSSGFITSNLSYPIYPGKNFTDQVTLLPVNLNYSMITGTVTDYLYSFPIEDAVVAFQNMSSSYTNSTGGYILFAGNGKYDINATAPLYQSYSTPLNVSSNSVVNIQLKPSKISLETTTPVVITHYFPLLFMLGFVSWTDYKGGNFSRYQIYVSGQSDFLNPAISTVSSQNTSYSFLTGIYPGHTYYISVVLWLTNSQVYQSKVIKISYSDPVYLTVNIILLGAIGFYVYVAYRIFRKKG